jgi:hypothetical protein
MNRISVILAATLAVAMPMVARAADGLVVVEARGVAFKPGQMIDADKPVVLKDGQLLTLISPNGSTMRLRGPYDQVPGAGSGAEVADLSVAFKSLVTRKGPQTNDVYAVRAGAAATLPAPWLIDISRPTRACIRADAPVVLWRADPSPSTTLTISPTDRSWKARATWPSGEDRLTIPENLPLADGATYLVAYEGSQVAVTMNRVPAALPTDAARAAWLAEAGCEAQAEALIRTIR